MSTGMPELGSKISLISKADIRYEGRLFTVDPQECTIALASGKLTNGYCHRIRSFSLNFYDASSLYFLGPLGCRMIFRWPVFLAWSCFPPVIQTNLCLLFVKVAVFYALDTIILAFRGESNVLLDVAHCFRPTLKTEIFRLVFRSAVVLWWRR